MKKKKNVDLQNGHGQGDATGGLRFDRRLPRQEPYTILFVSFFLRQNLKNRIEIHDFHQKFAPKSIFLLPKS